MSHTRCCLDADTVEVFRKIPVSCLPSDITTGSKVAKLAIDRSSNDLFITDIGCMFIIEVGLLDNSSSQFGYCWSLKLWIMIWHFAVGLVGCHLLLSPGRFQQRPLFSSALSWKKKLQFGRLTSKESTLRKLSWVLASRTEVKLKVQQINFYH